MYCHCLVTSLVCVFFFSLKNYLSVCVKGNLVKTLAEASSADEHGLSAYTQHSRLFRNCICQKTAGDGDHEERGRRHCCNKIHVTSSELLAFVSMLLT